MFPSIHRCVLSKWEFFINMRAAFLFSPSFRTLGRMGARKAAHILMKNSHFDRTQRYQLLTFDFFQGNRLTTIVHEHGKIKKKQISNKPNRLHWGVLTVTTHVAISKDGWSNITLFFYILMGKSRVWMEWGPNCVSTYGETIFIQREKCQQKYLEHVRHDN